MVKPVTSKVATKTATPRYFYISLLNVLSALAVVLLHANGAFWAYRDKPSWAVNNFIECLGFFAVPIFFMLTGATLFDCQDRYDTKTFFKRRFTKVLIPFVFWSLFGIFFSIVVRGNNPDLDINKIFNAIFSGSHVSIFWFFPPLICIYFAIPLFAAIDKKKKLQTLKYLALIGLTINVTIPFILSLLNYFCGTKFNWPYEISVVSNYLLFPILGYLIHKHDFSKKERKIFYLLAILGFLAHLLGTYFLSHSSGEIVRLFKGYQNLPCILYSIGMFIFIKYFCESKRFKKLIAKIKSPTLFLQKYTFALYLLHSFVMTEFAELFKTFGLGSKSIIYVPIAFFATIPTCILITFLLRKIPKVGKAILP